MNCYECHESGRTTAAVAVCRNCGAALCPEHIKVNAQHLERPEGMGVTTLKEPARRITCLICHDAEHQF
ncbi:DUF2180 family protein [Streptomyces sp. NBC_00986]|uniref:DUF2180 family protein n=1 Tax=Streptomyces sp. NBC_00986 TaxID=2903702 RepID=UPI00386C344A|nr:DUF2180 family protein [Streptomyces sp. NBC_00986]